MNIANAKVKYSLQNIFLLLSLGGFDGKVFLYDGNTSDLISEIGSPAHKGGVYAVAFKPDGSQLLTASGDKTCRLWDIETKELLVEFPMGTSVDDQQVSCLWQGEHLLSVSLSGFINYLDPENPTKPLRIIKGHNKPITAVTLSDDHSIIYTASHDGAISNWNSGSGTNDRVSGTGHGNQVNSIRSNGDFVYTCGIDDSLKQINLEGNTYTGVDLKLSCQPRGMDILKDEKITIVGCVKEIIVAQENRKISSLPINYEASSVAINSETRDVAVGGDDNKIHIYSLNGTQLEPKSELEHLGVITDCVYSPDNKYLVACDSNRKVVLYAVDEYKV